MEPPHSNTEEEEEKSMIAAHGFAATLTARPGMGDRLVDLLLTGLDEGSPGASEYCLLYLVSRSASDPDVVHVIEGWTSEEDHHRVFAGRAAQAIVARIDPLLAKESEYTDLVPVRGKSAL
jgi:quinol monooxygenase YgiN